jgi:hypothetical protein
MLFLLIFIEDNKIAIHLLRTMGQVPYHVKKKNR